MNILVDMDDVLENFCEAWIEALNKRHGSKVKEKEITQWELNEFFPFLTDKEIYSPLEEKGFWKNVKPVANARKILKQLSYTNDVKIVTASHYINIEEKMNWLFKYYPFTRWDDVIVTSKKQMIIGDVLIDDNPRNLIGGNYKGLLFTRPHNKSFKINNYLPQIIRVNNWVEIKEIIENMEKIYSR